LLLYYNITNKKEMANRKRNLLENVFMTEEQKLKVERQARRRADIESGVKPFFTKVHKNKKVYSRKNYQVEFE
jgi:Cu2+-containing amine oxidase